MELQKVQEVCAVHLSELDGILGILKKTAYDALQWWDISESASIIEKNIAREKEFYAYVYNALVFLIEKHWSVDDVVVLFDVDYTLVHGDGSSDQNNIFRPAFWTLVGSLQLVYPSLRFGILSGREQESINTLAAENTTFDQDFVFSSRSYSRDKILDPVWYSENSIDDHIQKVNTYVDISAQHSSIKFFLVDDGIEEIFTEKWLGVPVPRQLSYVWIAL